MLSITWRLNVGNKSRDSENIFEITIHPQIPKFTIPKFLNKRIKYRGHGGMIFFSLAGDTAHEKPPQERYFMALMLLSAKISI